MGTGVLLLAVAVAAIVATVALLARGHRRAGSAPRRATADEALPAEPFWLSRWFLMHWLPWRFTAAAPWLGIAFGLLAWSLLVPQSRWTSAPAFLVIIVAGEYSGEGLWRALQQRAWVQFIVGLIGGLLWLSAMGLHAGVMAGYPPPFLR